MRGANQVLVEMPFSIFCLAGLNLKPDAWQMWGNDRHHRTCRFPF